MKYFNLEPRNSLERLLLRLGEGAVWSAISRCSYLAGFIKQYPEFTDLLEPELLPRLLSSPPTKPFTVRQLNDGPIQIQAFSP